MQENQQKAAMESLAEWLAHPQELGKRPEKMECVGEFELHDLHYYMFRYQTTALGGRWLLGVCGGYEGDGLEHCGHVFSEMEEYNPATAEDQARETVEKIREYWMQRAAEAQEAGEPEGGRFLSFVLLDACAWDSGQFMLDLQEEWGISIRVGDEGDDDLPQEDDGPPPLVGEVDGMLVAMALMPGPVPGGEAEHNAATNYLWPEAVELTKGHVAHLTVAVMPRDKSYIDAGKLLVKLCDTCLKYPSAIGVYTSGTVFQPVFYRQAAGVMRHGELPYLNWVYLGLRQSPQGLMSGYTYGLDAFGKDEVEVVDTTATPGELRNFLFDITAYILSQDVVLQDGETIGFSETQRLSISRSPGFNLEGMTIKIDYMPEK